MKTIDYLVVGLLTSCLAVLTNQMTSCHFFDAYDKLLLTALWSCWLIAVVYYYLEITRDFRFEFNASLGMYFGLSVICWGRSSSQRNVKFVLPLVILHFKWIRKVNY